LKQDNFLDSLVNVFEHLPGVGKKTATRYAYYVVDKMTNEDVEQFSNVLKTTKKSICHCEKCGMLSLEKVCNICSDSSRDQTKIMVVKDTKDLLSIEATNQYNGLYHVLGGLISPIDGVSPDDLTIDLLEERSKKEVVKEIILATSFTPSGETTALYLEKILARDGLIISKLGYGLPAGGDIEYVDELTLKRAIDGRTIE
jgi:recombination protein RecR